MPVKLNVAEFPLQIGELVEIVTTGIVSIVKTTAVLLALLQLETGSITSA